ncbi:MAG TPA: ABC transporter permease [Candidatus Nanoarchaeia archaeon]|nr:ABC transporter permease [Candidatus Nanoarchaeia archaeon]
MKFAGILKKLGVILIFLLVWQLFSSSIIPPPTEVVIAGIQSFDILISDTFISLTRVFIGFILASILGFFVGLALYQSNMLNDLFSPLIDLLRPISPVAWVPIAIMWFGIGNNPAFFLVGLGVFFPVFTNTYEALRLVKKSYLYVAKNLGASKFKIITKVLVPAAMPQIITGLRIGLGVGWMALITAELVGATSGLGYMIQLNRMLLQTENVILGMVVIGIMGYIMNKIMLTYEAKITRWRNESIS